MSVCDAFLQECQSYRLGQNGTGAQHIVLSEGRTHLHCNGGFMKKMLICILNL